MHIYGQEQTTATKKRGAGKFTMVTCENQRDGWAGLAGCMVMRWMAEKERGKEGGS